jgi:hypothetical protein
MTTNVKLLNENIKYKQRIFKILFNAEILYQKNFEMKKTINRKNFNPQS